MSKIPLCFGVWIASALCAAAAPRISVYLTAENGPKLAKQADETWIDNAPIVEKKEWIFVDPSKTFQSVVGIGGALTDAAAETFQKLPKTKQE